MRGKSVPAHDIDEHLGAQIRAARMERGVTIEHLADLIQDDPEIVKAMEAGRTRVSAIRLARISRGLDKPLSWFYAGLPGQDVFDRKAPDVRSV